MNTTVVERQTFRPTLWTPLLLKDKHSGLHYEHHCCRNRNIQAYIMNTTVVETKHSGLHYEHHCCRKTNIQAYIMNTTVVEIQTRPTLWTPFTSRPTLWTPLLLKDKHSGLHYEHHCCRKTNIQAYIMNTTVVETETFRPTLWTPLL